MAVDPVVNFGKATVSQGYAAGDTSIVLVPGQGVRFPQASVQGSFNLVWWNSTDFPDPADDPDVEIVRVSNGGGADGDILTISRAQEGTAATSKNTVGKTYKVILSLTALTISQLQGQSSMQNIPLTGSGTTWSSGDVTPSGNSFIIDLNSGQFLGIQGGNYTVSGNTITFTSAVPSGYNSLILICLG